MTAHRLAVALAVILSSASQQVASAELYNANGRRVLTETKFLGGIQAATGINYGIGAFDTLGETERQTLSLGVKPRFDLEWELPRATLYSAFSMVAATTMLDGELSGQIARSGDPTAPSTRTQRP